MNYFNKTNSPSVQALPCSLAHIEANPDLKADHTKGVLVSQFDIMYEEFDNMVAAGNNCKQPMVMSLNLT